jgi:two-component system clock-associated histidine kinase SasA
VNHVKAEQPTTEAVANAAVANSAAAGSAAADSASERQALKLLLVAAQHHLASPDLRNLIQFLKSEECRFTVSLELADPARQPELLELHRLVATPALVKLGPLPKQVKIGRAHV